MENYGELEEERKKIGNVSPIKYELCKEKCY